MANPTSPSVTLKAGTANETVQLIAIKSAGGSSSITVLQGDSYAEETSRAATSRNNASTKGFNADGRFDVQNPIYGAKGDGSTDDNPAILSAYNAACAAAGGPNDSVVPSVYFPHPSSSYHIAEPLLLTCAHQIQLEGDSELATHITDDSDFPTMVLVPSQYASHSIGKISATSLVAGRGAALNFAGATPWYLNLSDAMVNNASPGAYPLNGLSQLDVRLFFKSDSLAQTNYLFYIGGDLAKASNLDCAGLGGQGAEAGLCINPHGGLCYQLTTGGSGHRACGSNGAITIGAVYEAEMAYNGSNIYVFLNGKQITGSPFTATGTVTQTPYTALLAGTSVQGYPDLGTSTYNYVGQMDSYQISKIARNTSNYAKNTSKFSKDSNTLLLINGKSFNNPLVEADSAYGATDGWLVARGFNGNQGAAPYVRDMTIDGGTIGVFQALEPSTKYQNVTIMNQAFIGLELWNNVYEGRFDNMRFAMPNIAEAAISGSQADNVEQFLNPQIITAGYHGIEGYNLGGEILSPFIAPGSKSVDGIYSTGDNALFALTVTDMSLDSENGGATIGLNLVGGGTYNILGGDIQTGTSAPCLQIRPLTGSFMSGINLYGTRCETTASLPTYVVDFLGSGTMVTPMVWYNPVVNHTSYSNQNKIPWTNKPASLMVYGDVIQPPVKTVATLPPCSAMATGWLVQVSDCNANCAKYLGTTFTGGGSTRVTVQCNGTAWELH